MSTSELFDDRVVVGLDGKARSLHAAHWAATWAARTGRGITLLAAFGLVPASSIHSYGFRDQARDSLRKDAEAMVDKLSNELREQHPEIDIKTLVMEEGPAHALLAASETATLTVLGARHVGALAAMLTGAVADEVVTHARGPVCTVPEGFETKDGAPVILGFDLSGTPDEAIEFAMRTASRFQRPLEVIYTWDMPSLVWGPAMSGMMAMPDPSYETLKNECRKALAPWLEHYPNVELRITIEHGSPSEVLFNHAAEAELLVVGTRGRGGFSGLLLGSTSRRLIQQTRCPTAVIPHQDDVDQRNRWIRESNTPSA